MKTIDATDVKLWLDKGEAVLIDVREPEEYDAEKIPGSLLMPLKTVTSDKLSQYTGKKIVFSCHSGRRSMMACETVLNIDTYTMKGGIVSWKSANYEIIKSKKFFIPLDNQVRITIGFFLIILTLLGYFVSQSCYILVGFIGLGLVITGFTGYCGLAMLITKMPWNKTNILK